MLGILGFLFMGWFIGLVITDDPFFFNNFPHFHRWHKDGWGINGSGKYLRFCRCGKVQRGYESDGTEWMNDGRVTIECAKDVIRQIKFKNSEESDARKQHQDRLREDVCSHSSTSTTIKEEK